MSVPGNRRGTLSHMGRCCVHSNNIENNTAILMTNDSEVTLSTAPSSVHQSNRRSVDQSKAVQNPCCSPCVVNNCNIVSSRGELARNSRFSVCDVQVPVKKKTSITNEKLHRKEYPNKAIFEDTLSRNSPVEYSRISASNENDSAGIPECWKKSWNNNAKSIPKSQSVPTDFKEEYHCGARDKSPGRVFSEGSFEKSSTSSSVFPILTKVNGGRILADKKRCVEFANGYRNDDHRDFSFIKEPASYVKRKENECPDFHTLSKDGKKSPVKKSVSFSSDTTFKEKKSSCKRTAVHESKVYRKGVLQDRIINEKVTKNLPPASESAPSGGLKALLRAAREGDDDTLRKIIGRLQKSDLSNTDFNICDSSGRTIVSYMAGIGSASILEAALSFPGIDPNLPDNEGNTPLHFAAQAGQTECLNILLQRCPDIEVDARNVLGFTPLMKAALQGRTKCAKILLFAGANPTLRDHGRGLRAEQWARFCGRYVCAEVIERFARHRLLEKSTTSCRWGSEPELAVKVLQGKVTPIPQNPLPPPTSGFKSKIRRVFRSSSTSDRNFSLVSQLTSAALCVSSPALPKPGDVPPVVKSLLRPLNVPQLRITLVAPPELMERSTADKCSTQFSDKIENAITKPPRSRKKSK